MSNGKANLKPFKKGDNNPGRPVGSKNKINRFSLENICATLDRHKADPFSLLCQVMSDPTEKTHHRIAAAIELCQYIAPRQRSVEFYGILKNDFSVIINLGKKSETIANPSKSDIIEQTKLVDELDDDL